MVFSYTTLRQPYKPIFRDADSHQSISPAMDQRRPPVVINEVKSGLLSSPRDRRAPYRFAPHYGETLVEFNEHLKEKLSDHRPLVVALPLHEPTQDRQG